MPSVHVSVWIAGSVKLPEKLDHQSDFIFLGLHALQQTELRAE